MAELVSPCCGAEYSDHIDPDLNEHYQCNHCEEYFEEPEVEYEYKARMTERFAEDRMDEKRDMGL